MSVRRRKTVKGGVAKERWMVDVKVNVPGRGIVRVRDVSPVDTRRGAEQHERAIRNSLADGSYWKAKDAIPTLSEFTEDFMAMARVNNSPSEARQKDIIFRNHLAPYFGKTRLDSIGRAQIENFKAHQLKRGLKAKTVNNHLAVLSRMLGEAVERGLLSVAPRIDWLEKVKPKIDFLSREEFDALIECAEPGRWRTMVGLILHTGLRIGEACALRWECVDLKSKRLIVRQSVWRGVLGTPKNGLEREVPLNDDALALLQEMPRRVGCPWVFPNQDGTYIHQTHLRSFYSALNRQAFLAGIQRRIGWHTLRHTFASNLVMEGVPLKVVQELLGHSSMEMTLRYAHLSPHVSREAVNRLVRRTPEGHIRGTRQQEVRRGTKKQK